MNTYYKPSGRITLGGILGFVLVGAVAAIGLAFAYVYATWYIPFIYVNVLLTLGFGALLGYVLNRMTTVGKLRSPVLVGWLALAIGLWAWYVQWAVYLTLLNGAGETEYAGRRFSITHTTFELDTFLGIITRPDLLLGMLPRIAEDGMWSIFTVQVSGFVLYLVWFAELVILLLFPWIVAHSEAGVPFSERAGQWAEKLTLSQPAAAFPDAEATKAALEAARWDHLQPLAGEETTNRYGRLILHTAPNDEDCCFLSLENVTIEVDNKGKSSEKTADVLLYLQVSPQVCRDLHARFGATAVPA